MKKLNRLLLIHWYSYENELISFDTINFMTGKTASGKSTIIDALQMVLMGETKPAIFNKAANAKSNRNLRSYLYGEIGDDGASSFHYIRAGKNFTSYVAVEFYDTEKERYFTNMFVADCYEDMADPAKKWIILNQPIPENHFINPVTYTSFSLSELRGFLSDEYGKISYQWIESNAEYQTNILAKYGSMKKKYLTLLKKAVPFTPVSDITAFINDSICDIRGVIDIEDMQSDIRDYNSLEQETKSMEKRIDQLTSIHAVSQSYESAKRRSVEQKYVIDRCELEERIENHNNLLAKYAEAKEELKAINVSPDEAIQDGNQSDALYQALIVERRTSDIGRKQNELTKTIHSLEQQLQTLREKEKEAFQVIHQNGKSWKYAVVRLRKADFFPGNDTEDLINAMCQLDRDSVPEFSFADFEKIRFLHERILEKRASAHSCQEELCGDLAEKKKQVAELEQGIKPYPETVRKLKSLLEQELRLKYMKMIDVNIFADCLEIPVPEWCNAIAGYLGRRKFDLLVETAYCKDALDIYQNAKQAQDIDSVGLADTGKLRQEEHLTAKTNSLAEEIQSDDQEAAIYAKYLLGNVIKCENAEELNQYPCAITKTCMLYENYVFQRMDLEDYRNPFIGQRSLQQLLENMKKELADMQKEFDAVGQQYRILDQAAECEVIYARQAMELETDLSRQEEMAELEKQKKNAENELNSLDLMYLDWLDKQIAELIQHIRVVKEKVRSLDTQKGTVDSTLTRLNEEDVPAVIQSIAEIRMLIAERYDSEWIANTGEPGFTSALKENRSMTIKESYQRALAATETTIEKLKDQRLKERQECVMDYKLGYDVIIENNDEFDQEMEKLNVVELPAYKEKIQKAQENAYRKFRDDFIAKLKSNIQDVKSQINELNSALRSFQFGPDRYRFTITPRQEYRRYYEMIMDDMLMDGGGYKLLSESFNEKYKVEIRELFDNLIQNETVDYSASAKAKRDNDIQRLTDYRTYLSFDLIVTNEAGEEQRLSKTMLKKSGGETQIPFYIALLASFSQVCRIRQKSQNNTIRLIILDEAFSKMDGERIRECIPLLREFGLQTIFSAPPDKAGDIAALVDSNIVVYRAGHSSFTKQFSPGEMLTELEAAS